MGKRTVDNFLGKEGPCFFSFFFFFSGGFLEENWLFKINVLKFP